MSFLKWQKCIKNLDARRNIALPGNYDETLQFCVDYIIDQAKKSIVHKGFFTLALSGGSTPKAILKELTQPENREQVEWDKILFFFGDERSVAPDDLDSNYKMAMDCALKELEIPSDHIFRMVAEKDIIENAQKYEELILKKVPNAEFDLITLGMGDDGHTASLFPYTEALQVKGKLVTVNNVPQKKTMRMSFTYECINQAHNVCFFVLGKSKADILPQVLQGEYNPLKYPSQKIGTESHKALWILDSESSTHLKL